MPAAPTLVTPSAGATGISVTQPFELRTSDNDGDYIQYKLEICSTFNCSSIIRIIDQTSSQTGWSGQDAATSTAYASSNTVSNSTLASHIYQSPLLSVPVQYWWRAYAIDPGGSNTWSAASAIQTFTTGESTTIDFGGGADIRGGTQIGNYGKNRNNHCMHVDKYSNKY